MAIINKLCLDKIITNTAADYISKGYLINFTGSYGGNYVDLTNPKEPNETIRIKKNFSTRECITDCDGNDRSVDRCAVISVERFSLNDSNRVWSYQDPIETIKRLTYYPIIGSKCELYTDSSDTYFNIIKVRENRSANKVSDPQESYHLIDVNKVSPEFREKIVKRIKRTRGMKNVKYNAVKIIIMRKESDRLRCEIRWNSDGKHGTILLS